MSDDVHISGPTGPNGERLEVNLKERRIGISVKDLLPILVVIGAFVGGLLVAKVLFLGQTRGHELLGQIAAQLNDNNAKILAELHTERNHADADRRAQNELLVKLEKYIEEWFTEIGTRLEWLDHNVANPERRMPLRAPAPREDRPPERSR
jgi:hypothetical protein